MSGPRRSRYDARGRVAYLDAVTASSFGRAYKPIAFELLDPRRGQRLLDLGCGTGDDARELAARVGGAGESVGVDRDRVMIDEARVRAERHRVSNVRFEEGDAAKLPFPDGYFDGARADRVLQMIPNPAAAIRELVRVTRAGGAIVVSNPGGGSEFDVGLPELTRRIESAPPPLSVQGFSGARLPNLFKDCGLVDLLVRPVAHHWTDAAASQAVTPLEIVIESAVASGTVSAAEGREWLAQVERARRADRFSFVHTVMIVRGTVPS